MTLQVCTRLGPRYPIFQTSATLHALAGLPTVVDKWSPATTSHMHKSFCEGSSRCHCTADCLASVPVRPSSASWLRYFCWWVSEKRNYNTADEHSRVSQSSRVFLWFYIVLKSRHRDLCVTKEAQRSEWNKTKLTDRGEREGGREREKFDRQHNCVKHMEFNPSNVGYHCSSAVLLQTKKCKMSWQ